ncbi:MAG: guanine permease [Rhodospirillaceae bacterium TMED8]|nr:guanine permease [Magnetovibrio sp.]OUT51680.1 MAG: guanine permease [Rhodospirillaceae bacterium TMED8]|tara:strand:+ start:1226 stop:2515 length:1290 start_codon:yes stop_codon:yes gene_type:complete
MVENFFKLREHNTDIRTEFLAGITTFLTMAYIIFVNPSILAESGMDRNAVFVATCLAAAIGSAIMGIYANYPFALAPGMGLNAYFTHGVVLGMGYTWQVALGAVFLSGCIFIILSILPVREWIVNAIPRSLKIAISAGIGLFLGVLSLKNAGIIVDHPATLVGIGDLKRPEPLLAIFGFFAIAILSARRISGAIILSVLGVTIIGVITGVSSISGVFSAPPSLTPTFMQMDVIGAINLGLVTIVFTFLFVDLFDTSGTLVGLAHRAGMLDENSKVPRLRKALMADGTATFAGAMLGTSTTTSYIESAAGINVGGRTGLTACVVSLLFLLCLFLAPLAGSIPAYATAPALLFISCLMVRGLSEIDWDDITDVAPAVIAAISMPLTFSIATGIGFGFVAYAVIKTLAGRSDEAGVAVWVLAALFILKFAMF